MKKIESFQIIIKITDIEIVNSILDSSDYTYEINFNKKEIKGIDTVKIIIDEPFDIEVWKNMQNDLSKAFDQAGVIDYDFAGVELSLSVNNLLTIFHALGIAENEYCNIQKIINEKLKVRGLESNNAKRKQIDGQSNDFGDKSNEFCDLYFKIKKSLE
jgi:hypothetical protein